MPNRTRPTGVTGTVHSQQQTGPPRSTTSPPVCWRMPLQGFPFRRSTSTPPRSPEAGPARLPWPTAGSPFGESRPLSTARPGSTGPASPPVSATLRTAGSENLRSHPVTCSNPAPTAGGANAAASIVSTSVNAYRHLQRQANPSGPATGVEQILKRTPPGTRRPWNARCSRTRRRNWLRNWPPSPGQDWSS